MTSSLLTILIASTLSQLIGLLGGFFLIWKQGFAHKFSKLLISFAAGALLSVALVDILPDALERGTSMEQVFAYTLVGIVLFFIIEKFLVWHSHGDHDDAANEDHVEVHAPISGRAKSIRPLVILGDALHNFLDGITIATTFLISPALGTAVTISVLFHEFPHNTSDFAILLHTGMERRRVATINTVLAFMSPLGSLLAYYSATHIQGLLIPLLAVAAGGLLYLALADLFPELQHERRLGHVIGQIVLLIVGIALMWYVGVLFPEHG